jgi:hypothetical protein
MSKYTKTKDELLQIIADCSYENYYSFNQLKELGCYLSEDEIYGENDFFSVEVENVRGAEGDGAEMFLTLKITDKETDVEQYVEFQGRYSSWDSSNYYNSYLVEPYQEMVTFYRQIK